MSFRHTQPSAHQRHSAARRLRLLRQRLRRGLAYEAEQDERYAQQESLHAQRKASLRGQTTEKAGGGSRYARKHRRKPHD